MSAPISAKPGVEVCVWIAINENGQYTNAFDIATSKRGRIGHAALKIFPTVELKKKHASLIQSGKDHVYVSLWPGQLVKTHDEDITNEGSLPNAIIRLNKLNVTKMLDEFAGVVDTVTWTLKAKKGSPLTTASCASFVYTLLEAGNIFSINGKSARYAGPGWDFYYKTNCHLGDIFGGIFNSFAWRGWAISPKLVLHVAASAAEADKDDKADTLALMNSPQVFQEPPSQARSTAAKVAIGAAVVVAGGVAAKKKFG